MLSKHRQLLVSLVFVLDALLIYTSWMAAYWLRFHVLPIPAPYGVPPIGTYLWLGAVLTPVALLVPSTFPLLGSTRTSIAMWLRSTSTSYQLPFLLDSKPRA